LNQPLLEELEIIVERWEKGALFVQEHPEKSKKSFRRFQELASRATEIVEQLEQENIPVECYQDLIARIVSA
jgi:exonuclease VII small subunit